MTDMTRRRLLAWGGNAAALGMLGGCESLYQSASLRSPVYDTSAADNASNSAAAVEPPSVESRPDLPALFDDIERRTFDFFWANGNPANGMVPDRYPTSSPASIAAIGMALTAYVIGVERGFITREQARTRTLATVRFFRHAPQGPQRLGMTGHKGFFYHFLDMKTGQRARRCELSTVDTALLIGGMLAGGGQRSGQGSLKFRSSCARSMTVPRLNSPSSRTCSAPTSIRSKRPRVISSS